MAGPDACRWSVRATIVAVACLVGGRASAQIDPFAGFDHLGDAGVTFRFDPDRTDVATYYVKASGEARFRIDLALSRLKQGDAKGAVEPLVEIATLFPDHMEQVASRSKAAPMRWVGAGEHAHYLLATLPKAGADEYAAYATLRVGSRLDRAIAARDERDLAAIASTWGPSPQGKRALTVLGDLYLERGAKELAARCYLRRMAYERAAGMGDDVPLAARTAAALAQTGDVALAHERTKGFEATVIDAAGGRVAVADALAPIVSAAPAPTTDWPLLAGANARDGKVVGDVRAEFPTSWQAPAFCAGQLPYSIHSDYPFHPVVVDGVMITTDALEIRAHALFSEQPLWTYRGPLAPGRAGPGVFAFGDYADPSFMNNSGTLARSLQIAATVAHGRVIASLLDANPRVRENQFDQVRINPPIPTRSLHCVDLATGKPLWSQRRPELGRDAFENRVSVVTPPLVISDRVYAFGTVLEGAINCFALCFALEDGRLLWRTPIAVGQQELTMFNKPFKEFTPQPPSEKDGTLFYCTNLGLVAAVDTLSGRLRWITQYDSIPITSSQNYMRVSERSTNWSNDPPVISGGVCVMAPLDSQYVIGFDVATGKRLWIKNWNETGHNFESVLGVDDGTLILVGQYALGFYDVVTGQKLKTLDFGSPDRTRTPTGRPCLGDKVVYVPFQDGLSIVHWRKGRYGVEQAEDARFVAWQPSQAGNVLVHGDFTITQSREITTVFFDVHELAARALARTKSAEATADDFLTLGNLERMRGRLDAAIQALDGAKTLAGAGSAVAAKADEGLFHVYRELAQNAANTVDVTARIRFLTSAAEHAREPFDFLSMAEELLEQYASTGDDAKFDQTLDWIDKTCPDFAYGFKMQDGTLKAGLFTLDRRAKLAVAREQHAAAVAAWQRMLERFPDDTIAGENVLRFATQRIAEAITAHGRDVYAKFEGEANELHESATKAQDVGALQLLVDRYPNAAARVRYRLDLGRAQLERKDAAGVFQCVSPLLQEDTSKTDRLDALALLARAAEAAGDPRLAQQYWKRVSSEGDDVATPTGEGETYASVARNESQRLDAQGVQRAATAALVTRPVLTPTIMDIAATDRTQLVPIEGDALQNDASLVLVYEPGLLRCIDVAGAPQELWRALVDDYDSQYEQVRAWSIGGKLVVRQRATIYAFDARSGAPKFRRELQRNPSIFIGPCAGLLALVSQDAKDGTRVAAMELASGGIVWQRDIDGRNPVVQSDADHLVVSCGNGTVLSLDPLLGATRFEQSLLCFSQKKQIAIVPEFRLLLASGMTEMPKGKRQLIAFDLDDGHDLWRGEPQSSIIDARWVAPCGDKLVALQGSGEDSRPHNVHTLVVLEPRTGRLVSEMGKLNALNLASEGPTVVDGKVIFFAAEMKNARAGEGRVRVLAIEPVTRTEQPLATFDKLDVGPKEFKLTRARDGTLVGTIDLLSMRMSQRPQATEAFAVGQDGSGFEHAPVVAPEPRSSAADMVVTPRAFVLLRQGKLFVFPAGGGA